MVMKEKCDKTICERGYKQAKRRLNSQPATRKETKVGGERTALMPFYTRIYASIDKRL